MKGDYSRLTFDPASHYSQVLLQQGRVLLDADQNEQTAILLHYLRTLAVDLIGPHGGPASDALGFEIKAVADQTDLKDFTIGVGRYYVDGLLVENHGLPPETTYLGQMGKPEAKFDLPLLVYLDVWERHLTALEDSRIREVALGEADTSARVQVAWRVVTQPLGNIDPTVLNCFDFEKLHPWTKILVKPRPGALAARARVDDAAADAGPCIVAPEARYRGAENQLYRVEIHKEGDAGTATFKWSRENGSVVFPIESVDDKVVTVKRFGRDPRESIEVGDWVEVLDDHFAFGDGDPNPLLLVDDVDEQELTVTLHTAPKAIDENAHPLLRRWDQQAAELVVPNDNQWLNLEEGVQIRFDANGTYRTGDYWLIPARTATGDVEWLNEVALRPRQVEHHFAPLAIIGKDLKVSDLRHRIHPLAACCPRVQVKNDKLAVGPGESVEFSVVIEPPPPADLTLSYAWSFVNATGGNKTDPKVTVEVTGKARQRVYATVVVIGIPGCTVMASGSAVILDPIAVKTIIDQMQTA